MTGLDAGTAIYLYGFVEAAPDSPPAPAGVGGESVELVPFDGFAAVVSRVPLAVYGEGPLAGKMKDVRWVAEQAALHERVVAWFVDRGPILPARLLTLYSSGEALERAAAARRDEIARDLVRFRSLREWDLKVAYDTTRLAATLGTVSPEIRRLEAEMAEAAPGRRYLLARRHEKRVDEEAASTARRLATELLELAGEEAAGVKRLPVKPASSPPAGGKELPVVLHAALLLPADAEERILRRVRGRTAELRGLGLDIHFSGPWAPYRFIGDGEPDSGPVDGG